MAYKIPKRVTGLAKTAIDPLGLGVGDAVFGKNAGPDYSAEEAAKAKALTDNQAATDNFTKGGQANYSTGANLDWNQLSPAEKQQASEMQNIQTDPAFKQQQLRSLSDLQEQSQNGFNASDRADMAKTRSAVDAANRGRQQAIMQNSQARGQGGSGLELVSQLQSAQDANQIEALRALETEANAEQRKTAASAQAGNLATGLSNQDFNQQASKAAAQDKINQFNTYNSNQNALYNNQGLNQTTAQNWNRNNQTSDRNASAGYDYRKDVLGANQNQNSMNYNAATDNLNGRKIDNAAAESAAAGKMGALAGVGGAIIGGAYGGPQGAAVGGQVGSGAGQAVGRTNYRNSYAHGGKVPGHAPHAGDDPRNDVVDALVSPEEVILPRTVAKDPAKAAEFVAGINGQQEPEEDAISLLLKAMQSIHSKGKK